MANLENNMFLMPDRLAVRGGEMAVRFPTESVALRMGIRAMWLHFFLPRSADAILLQIRTIESPWDEGVFLRNTHPLAGPRPLAVVACAPFQTEDAAAIDPVMEKWLYGGGNHGLQLTYLSSGHAFDPGRPPYLEIVHEPVRGGVAVL